MCLEIFDHAPFVKWRLCQFLSRQHWIEVKQARSLSGERSVERVLDLVLLEYLRQELLLFGVATFQRSQLELFGLDFFLVICVEGREAVLTHKLELVVGVGNKRLLVALSNLHKIDVDEDVGS